LEEGLLQTVEHYSEANNGFMTFSIYLPDAEINEQRGKPYPALYFLAGLTATHENAPVKSGFAKYAKKHRIAVVFPDTSPRKTGIDKIAEDWEFGESASYYLDATSEHTKKHFQMFTYITKELPELVSNFFPVDKENKSITGFSMGGHGALITALKTGSYRSVSAFAPMGNPSKCAAWGIKAFNFFFNNPQEEGLAYDATEILKSGQYNKTPLFVDVASNDQYKDKLLTDNLKNQLIESNYDHIFKTRLGYNHSFWYVSTFIHEHFDFHAKYLNWYS
jgi:S-formylglutathione hydrolase